MHRVRLLDTGRHHGRMNVALDQALIERHRAGAAPDSLRFLTFTPSVLIGRHQVLSREVDLDYCRRHGIDVGRRVTGGGAIYLDTGQLGWELIARREHLGGGRLEELAARICRAAAAGLAGLGLDARFRPRNDLEVGGRKIGGTGGFFDGDTIFYQGTILVALDTATMFGALRVSADKQARHALVAPAARVTSLTAELGSAVPTAARLQAALADAFASAFGLDLVPGPLQTDEQTLAAALYAEEFGTPAFVHELDRPGAASPWCEATHATPGGLLTVQLALAAGPHARIEGVRFCGDFFVTPPRVIWDLEQALRGTRLVAAGALIERFLAAAAVETLSLTAADFTAGLMAAAGGRHA